MSIDSDFAPTPGQAHLARAQEMCRRYQLTSPEALAEELAALYQIVSHASVGGLLIAARNGRSRLANDVCRARSGARKAQRAFAGALRDDVLAAGAVFANVHGDSADAARLIMQRFVDLDIMSGRKPAQTHIRSLITPLLRFWAQHRPKSNRRVSLAHTIADHDGTWVRAKPGSCGEFVLAALASIGADIPASQVRSQWGAARKIVWKETLGV